MGKFIIKGNNRLYGSVNISSAKNSVLPILVSTILTDGITTISNAPMLEDVFVLCEVLKSLSAKVTIDKESRMIEIDNRYLNDSDIDNDLVRKMRASFLVVGALVARFGRAKISLPGGCKIGSRPIDLHLKGLKILGADIKEEGGYVEVTAEKLVGDNIYLDFPSVGATENLMIAATLARGITHIKNAAREPEIEDLARFLRKMGARISGDGTSTIVIYGVDCLKGVNYIPIYDRIEAGTFMTAAAITRGRIEITGINKEHLMPVIEKMKEIGAEIEICENRMIFDGRNAHRGCNIVTMPHPGFPTDMQAQIMSLLSMADGESSIKETIFENRYMHVQELRRMGARININGRIAIIEGVPQLSGARVKATDLRAGAGLVIAALGASGETIVDDIYHIDRGYVSLEDKLCGLGADIIRVEEV